jgi:hypothetical protein
VIKLNLPVISLFGARIVMGPVTVDNRCVDTGANPALSDRFAQTIAAFMVHRHTEACRHQPSRGATHCRFAHTQGPRRLDLDLSRSSHVIVGN